MPNQLAQSKKRMTIAEHSAVLAALQTIALDEKLTVTDLFRRAARQLITEQAKNPQLANKLLSQVLRHAPQMPEVFNSAAKVAKFKREQREFDQLLQELGIAHPEDLQQRNSLTQKPQAVRLTSFS